MIMITLDLYMLCLILLSINHTILLTTFIGSEATLTRQHFSTPPDRKSVV